MDRRQSDGDVPLADELISEGRGAEGIGRTIY